MLALKLSGFHHPFRHHTIIQLPLLTQSTSYHLLLILTSQDYLTHCQLCILRIQSSLKSKTYLARDNFYPIHELVCTLLPKILAANLLAKVPPKPPRIQQPLNHYPNAYCSFHMDAPGHSLEDCWTSKHKI